MNEFAEPAIVALALLLIAVVAYYKNKIRDIRSSYEEQIIEVKSLWFGAGFDSGKKYMRDQYALQKLVKEFKQGK